MEEQRKIKEQGGAIAVQNPVLKWLDNYWYHYKWHTIVVAFFIFVGIVGFLIDSIKKAKQDNTTKHKLSVAVAIALLLFGLFMLADAFM